MSSGYVKLYSTIITSSIWLESHATLRVWITMLTLADRRGEVSGSIGGLAHIANVTREECATALDLFMSPDPDSRTPEHEGRRIEKIDGGWLVLNAEKYRDLRTETQVEWAEKKRIWREEQRKVAASEDTPDTSEDKPTASSSATASTSALEDVAGAVAREPEADLSTDVNALSRLLVTRCNQGMIDNPRTPHHTPVPHGHGASRTAAERILQAGIAPTFAADYVYHAAKAFKPDTRSRQIRSVGYFADAVIDAWERHQATEEARDTSRPVSESTTVARRAVPRAKDKHAQTRDELAGWVGGEPNGQ